MDKKTIAIDLDGVIWDILSTWVIYYNTIYNDNIKVSDIIYYDISKTMTHATREQCLDILSINSFWKNVYPFKYSSEYLKKLNEDYNLYIVTKTHYSISKNKFNRFFELFPYINVEQLIITYNKNMIKADYLIDDCLKNLHEFEGNKIIIDAPYNYIEDNDIIRAKDLKDVYKILKEI